MLHSLHFNSKYKIIKVTHCQDLGLKYLDLYLIHWPVAFRAPSDPSVLYPKTDDGKFAVEDVPLWETWEAMQVNQNNILSNL